jgi:hypothetical protein
MESTKTKLDPGPIDQRYNDDEPETTEQGLAKNFANIEDVLGKKLNEDDKALQLVFFRKQMEIQNLVDELNEMAKKPELKKFHPAVVFASGMNLIDQADNDILEKNQSSENPVGNTCVQVNVCGSAYQHMHIIKALARDRNLRAAMMGAVLGI